VLRAVRAVRVNKILILLPVISIFRIVCTYDV